MTPECGLTGLRSDSRTDAARRHGPMQQIANIRRFPLALMMRSIHASQVP
jgi:hypothetical protein